MMNPQELETWYQEFIQDLPRFLPDGIVEVDLNLLHEFGLLHLEESTEESPLTQSFYVVESADKLTLFNQKYVVWIVPKVVEQVPTTYTLVALNKPKTTQLEVVFTTAGIYNHSALVLRLLEKFLEQIEENEDELCKIKQPPKA